MRTAQWNDAVSVIDRVTLVLSAFGPTDTRVGVSELARRANLPKSTVSRLVTELVEHRYLERDGSGVRLGLRLFEMGELAARPNALREVALPVMAQLRDATGQTVQLGVLDGRDVLCIAVSRGRVAPGGHVRVGERRAAETTAMGVAMLAHLPVDVDTARDRAEQLDRVREVGFALACEAAGTRSVASAILVDASEPVAALSVTGRADLCDAASIGPAVRTAALAIGRELSAFH
jgi:IclR family acetate operon transcriptional repressor